MLNGKDERPAASAKDAIDDAERLWSNDVSMQDAQIYALTTRILYVASLVERGLSLSAARHGINTGEKLLLDTLRRLGGQASPAKLKAHLLLSFAGVGKRITRLESAGYIERDINPDDRRARQITLTDKGRAALERQLCDPDNPSREMLSPLSAGERRTLGELLRKVQHGLEEDIARLQR